MRGYALRRSLTAIPVLLGVSVLVFGFVHLIPGDPATAMSGEKATPEGAPRPSGSGSASIARSTSSTSCT